jgi:hypothetical protein
VKGVLKDTQDVLTKRNQHVYHYLYVDDRIFFSSERGLPVVLGLSSMRKSHSLFRLECPKSPGIFVPASIIGLILLGVCFMDRHFPATTWRLFTLNDLRPALEEIGLRSLPEKFSTSGL